MNVEDEKGAGVGGEEFVVCGADNHGQAAGGELVGDGVGGNGGGFPVAVRVVGC